MATVNHTPATPLPWRVANTSAVIGADGRPAARHEDSVYIAHAANAYPKLVEALRMVAPIIERFAGEAEPQNSVLDQRRDQLRALLHELGEAS